jgi:DNA polymerase elongation subunit (family B)
MDQFYTDITRKHDTIYHRGYRDGQQFQEQVEFRPTMYLPSNIPSRLKTIDGQNVQEIQLDSITGGYKLLRSYKDMGVDLHGMEKFEYQYIVNEYLDDFSHDFDLIKILNFDIEVGNDDPTSGFPDVNSADDTITMIAAEMIQGQSRRIVVFGLKDYTPTRNDVTYIQCDTESQLLVKFIHMWRKFVPDIVTGWNIEFFDIPYLVNRIERVLGERKSFQLSPYMWIRESKVYKNNKELTRFDLFGIQALDYLEMYQRFTYQNQESYRLDHIAHVELGERKVSYTEYQTLNKLYEQNYDKFIDYAIRDVELISSLERKLGILRLVVTLAHTTRVNFVDTVKQVRMWDIFVYHELTRRNIVPPPIKIHSKTNKYEGAYVKTPQTGRHRWVVSWDVNSLYPSLLRFLNISPETIDDQERIKGTVDSFLSRDIDVPDNDHSYGANGTAYRQDDDALFPSMVRFLYKQRKHEKKQMIDAEKKYQETKDESYEKKAKLHDVLQKVYKISLNSLYGAMGSQYFRYYSISMAEAITTTGQLAIRWIERSINDYLNTVVGGEPKDRCLAIDTDSNYFTLSDVVDKFVPNASTEEVVKFLDRFAEEKIQPIIDNTIREISTYLNATEPESLVMSREVIADVGIWQAKKRYALNVWNSEGVQYSKPKMKIMGLETAKSSTPAIIRQHMKTLLEIMLNGDEEKAQEFVRKIRNEFPTYDIEDIAFPRGISNIDKFFDVVHIYKKGTPIHVRGSLLHNNVIRRYNLESQYEMIKNGDKIKFIFLREPNPLGENVFAFIQIFPRETRLQDYIDYDTMFLKAFIEPMQGVFDAIEWTSEKKATLDSFFV